MQSLPYIILFGLLQFAARAEAISPEAKIAIPLGRFEMLRKLQALALIV